jgi:antitoxin VapB
MDSAKLFYNGRSQAVRLPKEFRFEGEEVYIKKIGSAVVLMPKEKVWEVHEAGMDYFSEDYIENRKQPDLKKRDNL